MYVLEVAFGKGTADPSRGLVVDVELDMSNPKSPVYLVVGSNEDEEEEEVL